MVISSNKGRRSGSSNTLSRGAGESLPRSETEEDTGIDVEASTWGVRPEPGVGGDIR